MIPYLCSSEKEFGHPEDTDISKGFRFRFPISPDHQLIVLIQFNALRAVMTNLSIMSLEHSLPPECQAAFQIITYDAAPATLPPALQPTQLQRDVPHEPWIDMIPFPSMRDNLILNQDTVDQDELCDDSLGGLYEGFDDLERRGIIAWGEPWSPAGWEVTEGFAKKWGFLLRGCEDLLEATQRYRMARGEERLALEIDFRVTATDS